MLASIKESPEYLHPYKTREPTGHTQIHPSLVHATLGHAMLVHPRLVHPALVKQAEDTIAFKHGTDKNQ